MRQYINHTLSIDGVVHMKRRLWNYILASSHNTTPTSKPKMRVYLYVWRDHPYIGASPDAIVTCDCCGKGIVEIKCPYCFRDKLPDDNPSKFCMKKDSSGK